MKANDTEIRKFLEGSKQFMVPLFQRTYSWEKENIKRLWDDLIETKNEKHTSHFFGSFVTMPISTPASGVSKYVIIDGQQRLVTMFIFLSTLRNRIIDIEPNYDRRDEINDLYLINKYHPEDKYKLVPTQADREIFSEIIDKPNPNLNSDHLIINTYKFFKDRLSSISELDELLALKDTILLRFSIVDICLDEGDDPYLIFESLNATGTPLTQADLIRNYLFMRITQEKQEDVYKNIWFPMQQKLGENLEDFFRHYLAMDGNIPNFNKIYSTFKETADKKAKNDDEIISLMKELLRFSEYYYKFLHPDGEANAQLKEYLQKINILEVTTSYPLLLRLYDDYINSKLSLDDSIECLKIIETFIVRRAVCGIPTNVLNKYFPTIYNSLKEEEIVQSLRDRLKSGTGSRRMPDDEEFKQCLIERNLYDSPKILRYILEEIEKYDNKEVVNFKELQIEHIMPQTLSDEWKEMLGENWELIHKKYVDILGNLTLTGYNQEYSNKSFIKKRDMKKGFRESGLRINRDLSMLDEWTEDQIKKRSEKLAEVALNIWKI